MRNIFILYMPPGNHEAMVHYVDTIQKKVAPERIYPHVSNEVSRKLQKVFEGRPIAVWGSRDAVNNRQRYETMEDGDDILIVEGGTIKLLGKVACKTKCPSLSQELWKNLRGDNTEGWNLIYFIANPVEIGVPFEKFCQLVGYQIDFRPRGFMNVAPEKLQEFYERYDDLYSILLRIRDGRSVDKFIDRDVVKEEPPVPTLPVAPTSEAEPDGADTSEHLQMQWMLLKMGKQAGEKVWAPRSDQSRITSQYNFQDFEGTFAAGLDAQVKYVENIDVVWKEEFRIDAAFEVENSTSIYSGLLRFADLTMVAPNTFYPLFIVAPSERRNRVKEQLSRPTFRHLKLGEKVRYLSYDRVKEINDFFGDGSSLNVNVLIEKAERFA
jgi:hypothetical protein